MHNWQEITEFAAPIGIVLLLLLLILILRRRRYRKHHRDIEATRRELPRSLQSGIARLHHMSPSNHTDPSDKSKPEKNFSVLRPLFNWSDNPLLVTDAVENGWTRFAFATYSSSPSVRSARSVLLGPCGAGEQRREVKVDINWEICQGSADFMQKIRLNPGLKKINTNFLNNSSMAAISVIRTVLPLPGPPLVNSAFPQEAYFEITVLSSSAEEDDENGEGEKTKLIQENNNNNNSKVKAANSESLVHVSSKNNSNKVEELKENGESEAIVLSVGLTGGGSLPLNLPGSYQGSIGFNSSGSIYLDGKKLVVESEKQDWGKTERVIGCGYNPSQRKVFFTVDSELVHAIHCSSEEFGTPLYPTLAANKETLVLVNFGQSAFKYSPANRQRTPNPCFSTSLLNSPSLLGNEDSKELFSMGRIDSLWHNRNVTARSSLNNGSSSNNRGSDFDDESESDLFEIVLDSGRSPNTVL